jgi:hypothetical protein
MGGESIYVCHGRSARGCEGRHQTASGSTVRVFAPVTRDIASQFECSADFIIIIFSLSTVLAVPWDSLQQRPLPLLPSFPYLKP